MNRSPRRRGPHRLLYGLLAGATAWAAGFTLQRLGADHSPAISAPSGPPARSSIPSGTQPPGVGALLAATTPWGSVVQLDRLAASLKPEEWPGALRTLLPKNRWLAQGLLLRWLERDTEAALAFTAQSTRGEGRVLSRDGGLELVVVKFLAGTDPERGWQWSGTLNREFARQCRTALLAALCEQDPAAAARLVSAHGDSTAAWGVAFPDLPASACGPALKTLAESPGPDSLLKRRMVLHTMSAWASKDFGSALAWWRQQPPQLQGLTLRGLGMALHILAPDRADGNAGKRIQPTPEDLKALAGTAMDHATPEDRRDFIARFLIHMSPTDPLAAVEWVAANLHGKERQDRLDSALAYLTPKGALEVLDAWDRLPQTGWPDTVFSELADKAAETDPAKTLDWMLKLPAPWATQVAGKVGHKLAARDPATARRVAESMTDGSDLSINFACGVADAMIPSIPTLGPDVPIAKPTPSQIAEKLRPAWQWAGQLSGAPKAAVSQKVLGLWAIFDSPAAAEAAALVTDPGTRQAVLSVVTENFFLRAPDKAIAWTATLPAADQRIVRERLAQSSFNSIQKTDLLTKLQNSTATSANPPSGN